MERAVIISAGPALSVDLADLKFPKVSHSEERAAAPNSTTNGGLHNLLEETERQQILQTLKQCKWVVAGPNGAAARLGMNRSTLQVRIRRLGISPGIAKSAVFTPRLRPFSWKRTLLPLLS